MRGIQPRGAFQIGSDDLPTQHSNRFRLPCYIGRRNRQDGTIIQSFLFHLVPDTAGCDGASISRSEGGLYQAGGPDYSYSFYSRGWPVQAPLGRGFSLAEGIRTVRKTPACTRGRAAVIAALKRCATQNHSSTTVIGFNGGGQECPPYMFSGYCDSIFGALVFPVAWAGPSGD